MARMSEFEQYLFNEGTLYRAYERLGAHLRTVEGRAGVFFAVWAPNAQKVSVIGDFNNWDGSKNLMQPVGSSGIRETFVPDLTEATIYKYEITTKKGEVFHKSDPYAFFSEVRPKSASIVWDINKYQWQDSGWMAKRKEK